MLPIDIEHLTVHYGPRLVLNDMHAAIAGKSIGLLGPNGAGKSTLIKTMLGFIRPTAGTVRVLGVDVTKEPLRVRQMVGYMPEHESFVKGLSAVRLLRYLGELAGLPPGPAMERAHEVLYFVGLGEMRYRPVETLSLGNQQRVKLAQALVHGPKLLILDEPTNALDPDGRDEMLNLVRDIGKISDSHVIMCSHLLQDVEHCCDSVMVIHGGRVAVHGSIADLRKEDLRAYDVAVAANQERFVGVLARRGFPCEERDRGRLRVRLPEGAESRVIFEAAREAEARLTHFHHKQDTLEEIFVNAIEESERSAKANGRP